MVKNTTWFLAEMHFYHRATGLDPNFVVRAESGKYVDLPAIAFISKEQADGSFQSMVLPPSRIQERSGNTTVETTYVPQEVTVTPEGGAVGMARKYDASKLVDYVPIDSDEKEAYVFEPSSGKSVNMIDVLRVAPNFALTRWIVDRGQNPAPLFRLAGLQFDGADPKSNYQIFGNAEVQLSGFSSGPVSLWITVPRADFWRAAAEVSGQ